MKKEIKKQVKKESKKLKFSSLMDKFGNMANMAIMGGILSVSKNVDQLKTMVKVQTFMITLTLGMVIGLIVFR